MGERVTRWAIAVWLLAAARPAAGQCPSGNPEETSSGAVREANGYVLAHAGLCATCHTDTEHAGRPFAGGRAIRTPFGAIYSTNLTPDRGTGIGDWTEQEFVRAMRAGEHRNGSNLFPAFPYTSFTKMTDADLRALWSYLRSLPPVRQANRASEIAAPFGWRPPLTGWKMMFLRSGPYRPDPSKSAVWNRGAYLAQAVTHCAECHTARGPSGGLRRSKAYAGTVDGPEGFVAPNITPDVETGIGRWSKAQLVEFLRTGRKPTGDQALALKDEVIGHGFRFLPQEDLEAIAEYVTTLRPIRNRVSR